MTLDTVSFGMLGNNCYLISSPSGAIAVDPGARLSETEKFFEENAGKAFAILLTHAHFDHIGGADGLRKKYNIPIYIGEKDAPCLKDSFMTMSDRFHAHIPPFEADIALADGEIFSVGDISVKTVFTPGHTIGGVCYLIENMLFSGDTLFYRSVGRTDFFGGDPIALKHSIDKLYLLPDETAVYPGHGEATTIGEEKRLNPYFNT